MALGSCSSSRRRVVATGPEPAHLSLLRGTGARLDQVAPAPAGRAAEFVKEILRESPANPMSSSSRRDRWKLAGGETTGWIHRRSRAPAGGERVRGAPRDQPCFRPCRGFLGFFDFIPVVSPPAIFLPALRAGSDSAPWDFRRGLQGHGRVRAVSTAGLSQLLAKRALNHRCNSTCIRLPSSVS